MKFSFDLSWFIVLFVILKVTGIIHISWWWLALPLGLLLGFLLFWSFFAILWSAIVLAAFNSGKIKFTVKDK